MFIPLGLERQTFRHVPWTCITFAALNIAVFMFTEHISDLGSIEHQRRIEELLSYWEQHPYLVPPKVFAKRFLPMHIQQAAEDMRSFAYARNQVPPLETLNQEQQHFDQLCMHFLRVVRGSFSETWALVPERGWVQRGLFGYMFLHGDLFHLLGNLFFLYLVGPALEEAWGRRFFAGFFLISGMVAGAAQAALNTQSVLPIVGASGAIAACMGAFAFCFAMRRMRIFYWFVFLMGTFGMPAWIWAGIWFVREVLGFVMSDGHAPIAFMAHIGGFVFGGFVALFLKLAMVESMMPAKVPQPKKDWHKDPLAKKAALSLQQEDLQKAKVLYQELLLLHPADPSLASHVAQFMVQENNPRAASELLAPHLQTALSKADYATLELLLDQFESILECDTWRDTFAFRLADYVASSRPKFAIRLYQCAAKTQGVLGAKALIKAAQLLMQDPANPLEAKALLRRALAMDIPQTLRGVAEEWFKKIQQTDGGPLVAV